MTNENEKKIKTATVVVNGQPVEVEKTELLFEEVIKLDASLPSGPNTIFTVTYRRAHGEKPDGTLVAGQTVKIKDGMIFNVTATDKS